MGRFIRDLLGADIQIDLGGIGPSTVHITALDTRTKRITFEHYTGKISELSFEDFEKLSGVKIEYKEYK